MTKRAFFALAIVLAWVGRDGVRAQQPQLPACTSSANGPVILAMPSGSGSFGCYVLAGATVSATTITIPSVPSNVTYAVPQVLVDGVNPIYTLATVPIAGSVSVFLNGVLQRIAVDYTIAGARITFMSIPQPGDSVYITYRR